MENFNRLKRVVIKEEYVALFGCFKEAVVFNQLMYWTDKVRDYDKFITEEQNRCDLNCVECATTPLCNGWIYKKAEELKEETLMGLSVTTIRRCLKRLIEKGYIHERNNPNPRYAFDKVLQYRVDMFKVYNDLTNLGFHLEGYYLKDGNFTNSHFEPSTKMPIPPNVQNECTNIQNELTSIQNERAIPEITKPEITKPEIDIIINTSEVKKEEIKNEEIIIITPPLSIIPFPKIKTPSQISEVVFSEETIIKTKQNIDTAVMDESGSNITLAGTEKLLKEFGEVNINSYVYSWTSFQKEGFGTGWFISVVTQQLPVPTTPLSQQVKQYDNKRNENDNRIPKSEQRTYSDKFYDSLYENCD